MSKYKFVYDTDIDEKLCHLSLDEIKIVLAVVLGKHNAIFYGYKPERLVKAISRINGEPIEELIDFDKDTRIQSNLVMSKDKLYIATASQAPYSSIVSGKINEFDVMYKCKEEPEEFVKYSKLQETLVRRINHRQYWDSGQYTMGKIDKIKSLWFSGDCYTLYENKSRSNRFALTQARFARSLADVDDSCVAYVKHFREAEKLFHYKDPDEMQMPF